MKKSVLLGAMALAFAGSAFAQELPESYDVVVGELEGIHVYDCNQGRLINKNKDNWFITL